MHSAISNKVGTPSKTQLKRRSDSLQSNASSGATIRGTHASRRTPRTVPASAIHLTGGRLLSPTRIFISYRRQDTSAAAAHLRASLTRRFGAERIFLDLATIKPGEDFVALIDEAIKSTSVFIALIGPRWLNLKGQDGKRRIDSRKDFVRLELESAIRHGVNIIPVLVDGAKMPARTDLPKPIADFSKINAYTLPWHEGIAKLGARISQIERVREERDAAERAKLGRVDLTQGAHGTSFTLTWAIEKSLQNQGHRVTLDSSDLWASMKKITGRPADQGFLMHELGYVIDFIGVKAKNSDDRYVARSYPLKSLREIPAQLKLKRPILTGVMVYESWFREPASKTGFVSLSDPGQLQGGALMAIVGWDPSKEICTLLTPWPSWGRHGRAMLTLSDLAKSVDSSELRSIEAVKLTEPIKERVLQREASLDQKRSRKGRAPYR